MRFKFTIFGVMYSTAAGDEFQKFLTSDKEANNWNNYVGKHYPSLKVKEIVKSKNIEDFLQEIKNRKEIIKNNPRYIKNFFPVLGVGDNDRGDLEFPLVMEIDKFCPDYYDGYFIYKCPFYINFYKEEFKKFKTCQQKMLKLDGLLVNAKKITSTEFEFNFTIIEIKLATNIWSSYIVKSLIYWLNLNELLKQLCENLSLNCKFSKKIIFILGREKQNGYNVLANFFEFENAEKRLEIVDRLIEGLPKLDVPPIRPVCFSVGKKGKCPFLEDKCLSKLD